MEGGKSFSLPSIMFRWAPYTFVRILFFLIAGILIGIFYPDILPTQYVWTGIIALVCLYVIIFLAWHFLLFKRFNPGAIGLAGIFLSGFLITVYHNESRHTDHVLTVPDSIQYVKAVVTGYPEEKQNSWKAEALITDVFTGRWERKNGKVILYFSKADFLNPFEYGDEILLKGSPQLVAGPANPGEFDYRRYLSFRNIYHQWFIRSGDAMLLGNNPPSVIMAASMTARAWADKQLKSAITGEREQGIASALVLGITDGIDHELLGAYSATGAMHILAVSGLHISIIYLLILWLCKPLLKYRAGPWILAIISLFLLWGYAFITGLSPSVLRAVTMFSFVALAKPARQFTNIYNILAVSAFFLLIADPFLIMSVGFQLSYIAVLGIVYLQPGLYQLWNPKNYLMDETWKLTTVSVAAQIATLPLGLLYFHQFPNYFLITNLLVIPVSFVVLIVGIAVIVVGFVSILSGVLGWVLTWSIKLMNGIIFLTESLPFAITDNVRLDLFQCWMLIGIIVCVTIFLQRKRFAMVFYIVGFVTLFTGGRWFQYYRDVMPARMIVYNLNNFGAIDLIRDGKAYFVADSLLHIQPDKISFHIQPYRLTTGVKRVNGAQLISKKFLWGSVIQWEGKIVVHLNSIDYHDQVPKSIKADYLVISGHAVPRLSELSFNSVPPKIILDTSNSYFYSQRIVKEAKALGIGVTSVRHQGAYQEII
jgi:competence protein ComEC